MDPLNGRIAKNLSAIREKRNMSLDDVANLTGVTKATIGQIERGTANPTVSTLWKIANGLKISFSSLVEQNAETISLVPLKKLQPIIDEIDYKVYPMFFFDPKKRFETFYVELGPGGIHISEKHQTGTEEYVIVSEGELEVEVEDHLYQLAKGDAIHFYANVTHTYRNTTDKPNSFSVLIYYAE